MAAHAKHPLIRAAKSITGVKVYYYDAPEDLVKRGSAPSDTIYDEGAIYVGPQSAKRCNGVLHDLVHCMVADTGRVGSDPFEFNFNASIEDEVLTCEIEFWLGYHSSYYSFDELAGYIREYNYTNQVCPEQAWWDDTLPLDRVLAWLAQLEKSVRGNRHASQVAAQLGI